MPTGQVADGFFGEGVNFTADGFGCTGRLFRVISQDTDLQGDFTVEYAFKWKGSGIFQKAFFQYHNPVDGETAWRLYVEEASGDFFVALYVRPPGQSLTEVVSFTIAGSDTVYHHLAATYDLDGNAKLYVDGIEVDNEVSPFGSLTMTSQATSRIELTGAADLIEAFKIDNARFIDTVDLVANILDRATNGLPGD